jgi:hypothetical protein
MCCERYFNSCNLFSSWSSNNQHSFRVRTHGGYFSRWLEGSPNTRDSGISGIHRESGYQTRLCGNESQRETHPMTKRLLLSMSLILSTAITAPVFAQAVVQEPDAYALYLPRVGAGIGSAPAQRRDVPIVSHGTDDATASAPSAHPWRAGNETAIKPWSAPVGHHQPRAADASASTSASLQILDQEDANVDRIIRSVCRGC